jgi:large repetitive protein
MFRKTPVFGDFVRFVIWLVFWQALVSTGYGQQSDDFPPVAPKQVAQRSSLPAAGNALPSLTTLPGAGAAAQPLAQALSNVALSAPGKAASVSKRVKPRTLPATPITTIADPADGTDPYIVAEAQMLGNSATQIFAFVRDQVGFDVYAGSLRGARGTLWTNAGNALDRASLLIALLRAAGYTAQYVQGTLTGSQATQILQQIFANPPLGVLGCIPAGTTLANPVSDPTLNSTLQQHFWVQYASNSAGPFQNADPSFSGAQLGQVFGTAQTTFTTVPASLETTVAIELDAEIYNQAETLFGVGDGLSSAPVLNATFATDQTAGRPLAIGHIVTSSSIGGAIFSAQNNTYTPYVAYGNENTDPSQDTIVTGTEYQEEFTNFPLGTTVVTGVFLTFTVTDSNGNTQTFNKTLLDLIGYSARQNGSSVSVSVTPSGQPSISPDDLTAVNVLASLQNSGQIQQYATTATAIQAQLTPLAAAAANPSSPPTAAQSAAYAQLQPLGVDATMVMLRFTSAAFAAFSDRTDAITTSANYVKAYFNSPRLIVVTNHVATAATGNTSTVTQELDLLKDDKSSIPLPGQNPSATVSYNLMRGGMESTVESQVYQALAQSFTPQSGVTLVGTYAVADIFAAAQQQGIGLIELTSANAGQVNNLPITADAQARISNALAANLIVVAPSSPVALSGGNTYGWYQIDPTTGATESVGEDGAHQGILEGVIADILGAETSAVVIFFRTFHSRLQRWLDLESRLRHLGGVHQEPVSGPRGEDRRELSAER